MAQRISRQSLILVAILAIVPGVTVGGESTLVSYSFDDEHVATGPDTFKVFESAQGSVDLSSLFRFSGYRSVEIRDVAGDRRFPELQGYFPLRRSGQLFAHFAFMSTDVDETFNVALAGPQWFALRKDGIGFWLQARDGSLYHHSDGIPKRLTAIRAFVWYIVDVAYDVDGGTYDLTIHEEGHDAPLVRLTGQANASSQPGSAVDKFSFIGDRGGDTSNVVYYVDDVVLSADEQVEMQRWRAPGRRKLFIDSWLEYQRLMRGRPGCLPAVSLKDFGINGRQSESLKREHAASPLELVARHDAPRIVRDAELPPDLLQLLQAISSWTVGCAALEEGKPRNALAGFEEAARLVPEGRIYHLSAALALAGLERWDGVETRLAATRSDWEGDPRYDVAAAVIGLARGDLDGALSWLQAPAEEHADGDAGNALAAEQYFLVLVWRGSYREAGRFAMRVSERFGDTTHVGARWLVRAGDASLLQRDLTMAGRRYERALKVLDRDHALWTKLSDVHFLAGDVLEERRCREQAYGSLMDGERD